MIRQHPGRTAHCGYPAGLPARHGRRYRRVPPARSRPAAGPPPSPGPAGHRLHRDRYRTSGRPVIRTRVPRRNRVRSRARSPAYPTRVEGLRPRRSPACRSCPAASPVACRRKLRRNTVIRNHPHDPRRPPGRDRTAWPNSPPDRRGRSRTRIPGNATASSPGWRACDRRAGSRPGRRPPPTTRAGISTEKDVRSA